MTLWHEAKALFPTQVVFPSDFDPEEAHTLILALRGEDDRAVLFAEAERVRDLLTENGYDVTFRPFEGGHVVPQDQFEVVISWIQDEAGSGR